MQESIDELLKRALDGDKAAENKLFSNLSARFLSIAQHRICNPQKNVSEISKNAEDIVQETLEILYKNYKSVDFSVGFLQYAFGVLRNKIGDYFKKKRREELMNIPFEPEELVNSDLPDDIYDANELREQVIMSLGKFSIESQKIIYALIQGYSSGGMTGVLFNIPRGTLDSKISRVRKKLKKIVFKGGRHE